jgi:hypothetical protein
VHDDCVDHRLVMLIPGAPHAQIGDTIADFGRGGGRVAAVVNLSQRKVGRCPSGTTAVFGI